MENDLEDLKYLLAEMKSTLIRNRDTLPKEVYPVLLDLVHHSSRTLKEMEVKYAKLVEAWNDCLRELRRFSRQ